jgi:hypothetical protein
MGAGAATPSRWIQQWDRVQRWYERFREIDAGRTHTRVSDFYQDVAHAFFLDCFHLKDWLKNDPTSGISSGDVERFLASSSSLQLCADLANGSKHLVLTTPRVDPATRMSRRHFKVGLASGQPTTISAKYEIRAGGQVSDAFQVASSCRQEWEQFLKRKGLL